MAMAVGKGRGGAKMGAECVNLAQNLFSDLGLRQFAHQRSYDDLAHGREAARGSKFWHWPERTSKGEVEVEPDIGGGRVLPQFPRA